VPETQLINAFINLFTIVLDVRAALTLLAYVRALLALLAFVRAVLYLLYLLYLLMSELCLKTNAKIRWSVRLPHLLS